MFLLRDAYLDSYIGTFEGYRRNLNTKAFRIGIIITVAVQVPFLLFEWLALREDFFWIQALRALWLGPAVALYPLLKEPSERLLRHVDGIIWFIYVASAAFAVLVAFLHEGYQSPYIHVLILMFVGVGAVTLWPLWFSLLFAAVVYGAYWTPFLFGYGSLGDLTNWIGYQCFMIGTMGIVLISQQLRLEMAQADFERRCRLQEKEAQTRRLLERVAVLRQERLTWLENLARFLRHELKNQTVAMGTSLDLAESAPSGVRPERYLERARRSLSRMNRLVQSATEATSLEAALAVESTEPVDLSGVVGERVLVYRQANLHRRVRADIAPGLEIEGQEDRIVQLLDKLLDNAVEHTVEGGDIRVTLKRDGADALLAVENEGERLAPNRDALFDAFVTVGKDGEGGQNLGLGLFVAKAIAESHGGTIEARDGAEGSGACFEVRLPAG